MVWELLVKVTIKNTEGFFMNNNEGIVQHNGTINAGQLVVGSASKAVKVIKGGELFDSEVFKEINEKLNELLKTVNENSSQLDNQSEIVSSTEVVVNELSKEKPNKLTITAILEGIANGVKSVNSIGSAALGLKSCVEKLL